MCVASLATHRYSYSGCRPQERAPIYQCFYAGYYIIWKFFVIPEISTGKIVTAYGRPGRTVNESCP